MVVDIVESWALQRGHFHATQRLLFVDSPEAEASDAASFARSLLHFCFCALQCILRLWGCRFLSGSTKVLAELPRHGKYSSEPRHITCLYFYLFFFALFSWCPSCKCECIWEKTDILRRGRLANFGRLRGLIVISSDMHTETRHQKSDSVFALAGRKVPTILTSSQRSDFFPQILRMERNLKNHNLYTFCPRWQ